MWVKNTKTGLVWNVSEEHGRELLKQSHYVEVEPLTEEKPEVDKRTPSKRNNPMATKDIKCEVCGRICKGQRSHTQHLRMAHGIKKDGDE